MQFSQEHNHAAYVIKSYDENGVKVIQPVTAELVAAAENEPDRVNELRHLYLTQSLVMSSNRLHTPWQPRNINELASEDIETILGFNPEIVILGTGRQLTWPHPRIMAPLMRKGIGYEVMANSSACRTYNVLMHEGRKIVLALMF